MACLHKFADDLFLERLSFQPITLIIGTFNPGWDKLNNTATWFYGRRRNNYFWDVLPRLYGQHDLRPANHHDWKTFCHRNSIALTDLIYSIDDADDNNPDHFAYLSSYRDDLIAKYFKRFTYIDIPVILAKQKTIKHIYFTRSINEAFWWQRWQPIDNYCEKHGIKAKPLLTPSGGARFQMPKDQQLTLRDFIFQQWQNSWHST
jgi:hypothetical protein